MGGCDCGLVLGAVSPVENGLILSRGGSCS